MKKEVIICDMCRKELPCESVFIKTGRECDGAGSMCDVGEHVDICLNCAAKFLQFFYVVTPISKNSCLTKSDSL